jgi:hypothetical protein
MPGDCQILVSMFNFFLLLIFRVDEVGLGNYLAGGYDNYFLAVVDVVLEARDFLDADFLVLVIASLRFSHQELAVHDSLVANPEVILVVIGLEPRDARMPRVNELFPLRPVIDILGIALLAALKVASIMS